jgi:hypothetical protein
VASGLVNTSRQIGGAIGLAAVSTIAATASRSYAGSHAGDAALSPPALTHGFQVAFYALLGLALLGAAIAAAFVESRPKAAPSPKPAELDVPLAQPPAAQGCTAQALDLGVRVVEQVEQFVVADNLGGAAQRQQGRLTHFRHRVVQQRPHRFEVLHIRPHGHLNRPKPSLHREMSHALLDPNCRATARGMSDAVGDVLRIEWSPANPCRCGGHKRQETEHKKCSLAAHGLASCRRKVGPSARRAGYPVPPRRATRAVSPTCHPPGGRPAESLMATRPAER